MKWYFDGEITLQEVGTFTLRSTPAAAMRAAKGDDVIFRNQRTILCCVLGLVLPVAIASAAQPIDAQLKAALQQAQFTGEIESHLTQRLGRPVNPALAELGRLLFFDKAGGVHKDNMCGGCHAPANGMGDSQTMAIGVQN